jgi:hypothetical protein
MGSIRLVGDALGHCRRVAHGLDGMALSLLMEIVARVAERKLLSVAERQSPDAADDQSSPASPAAR